MLALILAMLISPPMTASPAIPQASQPESATKAYAEGEDYLKKNDYAHALEAYNRAIAADGSVAEFHLQKCRALVGLQRHEEAIQACSEAIRLRPNYAEALRDRGHFYINLGRYAPALADLKKAESLDHADRVIYYHLGLAYYLTGDFKNAATAFQGCLKNAHDQPNTIECTAWLYPSLRRSGQDAEAKKVLASIDPNWKVQGHTLFYFDRLMLFKGAKTEQQVAPTMNSEGALSQATVGYGIGLYEMLSGNKQKARDYFQKALASGMKLAFGYRAAEQDLKRLK